MWIEKRQISCRNCYVWLKSDDANDFACVLQMNLCESVSVSVLLIRHSSADTIDASVSPILIGDSYFYFVFCTQFTLSLDSYNLLFSIHFHFVWCDFCIALKLLNVCGCFFFLDERTQTFQEIVEDKFKYLCKHWISSCLPLW